MLTAMNVKPHFPNLGGYFLFLAQECHKFHTKVGSHPNETAQGVDIQFGGAITWLPMTRKYVRNLSCFSEHLAVPTPSSF